MCVLSYDPNTGGGCYITGSEAQLNTDRNRLNRIKGRIHPINSVIRS